VKFQTFVSYALALAASLLLASCGGGGATGTPNVGGAVTLLPTGATFYAGVPATMTLSGGRKPYALTSSEPGVLPVPSSVDSFSFDVVPNQPGVIDSGLPANALPVRTVTLTVRDSTGGSATSTIKVAQNFLTGYNLAFVTSTCAAPAGATTVTPCAGGDTAVQLAAVFNGNLHGNETFRLEVVRGQFAFYTPNSSTGVISNSYTTTSDHEGKITAIIRVPTGVPPQIAIVRVVHVASGASTEHLFTIAGGNTTLVLTAIPATITFTGADSTSCGTGQSDFFVFDGVPPYSAVSANSGIGVSPTSSSTQPGRFTVTIANGSVCADAAPVIVTDALGNRVVVTVSSVHGSTTPPPAPTLAVAPNAITLACGTSGSVAVVGGTGVYNVTSSHPRVTATVSGQTVTITRAAGDGAAVFPTTGTISITDGASIVTVVATVPANCP